MIISIFVIDTKESVGVANDSSSKSENSGLADRRPVSSLSLRSVSSKYLV